MMADPDHFRLVNIQVSFTSFKKVISYESINNVERTKQFAYDVSEGILLIVYMVNSEHEKKRFMKIIDLHNNYVLFNSTISDKDLVGRLKCGIFSLVGGHLYYDNRVIKIRYDLLRRNHLNNFLEPDCFDFYYKIFDLNEEFQEEIQMFFPKI